MLLSESVDTSPVPEEFASPSLRSIRQQAEIVARTVAAPRASEVDEQGLWRAAVGRMARSIAYEISNLLEAVTNLLFLARQSAETPEMQEYLDTADRELRRTAIITNQTLGFHKQSSNPQVITAQELLESVLRMYQARLASSHVVLEETMLARKGVSCFGTCTQSEGRSGTVFRLFLPFDSVRR